MSGIVLTQLMLKMYVTAETRITGTLRLNTSFRTGYIFWEALLFNDLLAISVTVTVICVIQISAPVPVWLPQLPVSFWQFLPLFYLNEFHFD
jgi:hypothetical protein